MDKKGLLDFVVGQNVSVTDLIEENASLKAELKAAAQKYYEMGRNSAMRKNKSGCVCKFDEEDNIIELCSAHSEYIKAELEKFRLTRQGN